jgi:hypothetical protein
VNDSAHPTGLRNRWVAAATLWALALAAAGVAIALLPEGQCGYDNHDRYVTAAHRGGAVLGVAAGLGGMATIALFVARRGLRSPARRRLVTALALLSVLLTGFMAFVALLALITFGCLE